MLRFRLSLAALLVVGLSGSSSHPSAQAVSGLNPKAIRITLPNDIKWIKTDANERAVLYGDPSKPVLWATGGPEPPTRYRIPVAR